MRGEVYSSITGVPREAWVRMLPGEPESWDYYRAVESVPPPAFKLGAIAATPALQALKTRLDPRRYNGASMIGLNGIVIKSHGGADQFAFQRAIEVAILEARQGVPSRIAEQLERAA